MIELRLPEFDFAADPLPNLHEILASRHPERLLCPDHPVDMLGDVLRGPRSLWVALASKT